MKFTEQHHLTIVGAETLISKVPEGHHRRGTTLREALLRGYLPLRGLRGGLSEGSAEALRCLSGGCAGLYGGPRDFPRVFGGSDPMPVTFGNCWRRGIIKRRLLSGVAPANQRKVSSFHTGIPEQKFNVNCACFPKEKHQNSQKWAKQLMNFSFWPFLWFGLPGRLLILQKLEGNFSEQVPG